MQGNNFSAAQIKAITAAGLDVKILSEKKVKCESAVPGKPAERLGAVTAIPTKEQDAARKRLLDKQSELKKEETIFERERVLAELHKGRHGQSEKDYQAGRSDAGKRISGDEKHGPASYTRRGVVGQEPTKPGEKPEHTPKLGSAEKNELAYRKSRLKKEDVEYVEEERARVTQNGNIYIVGFVWLGKYMIIKLFFPEVKRPSRKEAQFALDKIYPGAKIQRFDQAPYNPSEPMLYMGVQEGTEIQENGEVLSPDK